MSVVDCLPIPLGVSRLGDEVSMDLVSEAHAVITGATRSGKSQLMYGFLGHVAMCPAVRVVGVDPSRVLLSPFLSRGVREPLIALGSDPVAYQRVVSELVSLLEERLALLDRLGLDKFAEFSPGFPLVLAVFEEFPGAMSVCEDHDRQLGRGGTKVAPVVSAGVRRLVREGAKAGIRVVLVAQRADAAIVGGDVRANLSVRICFRLDDAAGLRMVFESLDPGDAAQVETFAPGVGFVRTASVPFQKFRGFYVGDYAAYRSHVQACDPRVLANLEVDREFRLAVLDEFGVDPG